MAKPNEKTFEGLTYTLDEKDRVAAAVAVGELIAKRAKEKGVERVAFDRSGFKFHGRIKALGHCCQLFFHFWIINNANVTAKLTA